MKTICTASDIAQEIWNAFADGEFCCSDAMRILDEVIPASDGKRARARKIGMEIIERFYERSQAV